MAIRYLIEAAADPDRYAEGTALSPPIKWFWRGSR